jgi:hypothetical protein
LNAKRIGVDATVANIKRNKGDLCFIEFLLSSMEIHALTALGFSELHVMKVIFPNPLNDFLPGLMESDCQGGC